VQEEPGSLEMREELVSKTDSFARSLEQARNVGDGELAAVWRLHRTEHRLQRRERVVGDPGAGGRYRPQQG